MKPQREKSLILSVLRAHLLDGTEEEVPWGITEAGWDEYAHHWCLEVREAVRSHPHCPTRYLPAQLEFKFYFEPTQLAFKF